MLFGRSKEVVGLDIGSSSVKLVELKEKRGGEYHLQRVGLEQLSPEAIVDGSIMDSSLVVDAIARLAEESGVRSTNFATSLSGHSVIIKKIQVPAMSEEELAESIQWEAEQYVPFDINDVRLDYLVFNDGVGTDSMEVLLVAVKQEKVNDYVSVISQAGMSPVVVDVDAFAVQNAYEVNYDLDPHEVVALVNMGAGVTTINILARGSSVFWRDISTGGNQFTEALQVLEAVATETAAEIQKTFDFFAATAAEDRVGRLVLSGGCALTPNLRDVLEDRFGVPVELMDPLRRVRYKEADFDSAWLQAVAPMLGVAVGLAFRRVGD